MKVRDIHPGGLPDSFLELFERLVHRRARHPPNRVPVLLLFGDARWHS
jgi:hypothetical protein